MRPKNRKIYLSHFNNMIHVCGHFNPLIGLLTESIIVNNRNLNVVNLALRINFRVYLTLRVVRKLRHAEKRLFRTPLPLPFVTYFPKKENFFV